MTPTYEPGDLVCLRPYVHPFQGLVHGETRSVVSVVDNTLTLTGPVGASYNHVYVHTREVMLAPGSAQPVSAPAESDPTGRKASDPGSKLDAGKVRPGLLFNGMPRALWAVAEVATFGADKYTDGGWLTVPNGEARYNDAKLRHLLKKAMGELTDADSHKLHLAHEAWNALATLELYLRQQETQGSQQG